MDPLTILSLVETCAGLSVTAGKLAIGLKTLAGNYQSASLTFRSLSSQCRLFACAVRAIQSWMDDAPDQCQLDDSTWEQLADSLEVANDAIYALETELTSTSGGSVNSFWKKLNVVWNMANLRSLEDCIHKQVSGLSVILQIMSLPTFQKQKESLRDQRAVFHDSRSSATTICDPGSSTIRGGDLTSVTRASTVISRLSQLPTFDFDEMLMASQVYLRNRNKTMALHSSSTRTSKTRDMGVSVSAWDINPNRFSDAVDLGEKHKLDKAGLRDLIERGILPKLEELQAKYSKVKRYYFAKEAEVERLEHENGRLLVEIEEESKRRIHVALNMDDLHAENIKLRRQDERNEKQIRYWMDQCGVLNPSTTSSSTIIGFADSSPRADLKT